MSEDRRPEDTENTLYIYTDRGYNGPNLQDLIEQAQAKWPGIRLVEVDVGSEYFHARCTDYPKYDPGDYDHYIMITASPKYFERIKTPPTPDPESEQPVQIAPGYNDPEWTGEIQCLGDTDRSKPGCGRQFKIRRHHLRAKSKSYDVMNADRLAIFTCPSCSAVTAHPHGHLFKDIDRAPKPTKA